jgi:hypothetical protein
MVDSVESQPARRWPAAAAALAAGAVSATLVLAWRGAQHQARPASHAQDGASPRAAPIPVPSPPPVVRPRFEVVRVGADGSVVIAGRAAPGDQVSVREGERAIGQAEADAQGAFVIVPAAPLPPGAGELTLSARPPGRSEQAGIGSVVLAVPARENGAETEAPLAVLVGTDAPHLLQVPGAARPGHLGLQSIQYDRRDGTCLAGAAPPGAPVRLYIDDTRAGDARTEIDGRWMLRLGHPLAPGRHWLRLDQLDASGQVVARIAVAYQQEDPSARRVAPGSVSIEPGAGFWRIIRASQNADIQYLVVFRASRRQNRRPGRIYPGQVFNAPARDSAASGSVGALEPSR